MKKSKHVASQSTEKKIGENRKSNLLTETDDNCLSLRKYITRLDPICEGLAGQERFEALQELEDRLEDICVMLDVSGGELRRPTIFEVHTWLPSMPFEEIELQIAAGNIQEDRSITLAEAIARRKKAGLREPIVHGYLRRGEVGTLVAPPKTGKSWLALQLALSVAGNCRWLGKIPVTGGRVLLLDYELDELTIGDRAERVAEAMGQMPHGNALRRVEFRSYRGRPKPPPIESLALELGSYRARDNRVELVIVDALYCALGAASEADHEAMSRVYAHLIGLAEKLDSAVLVIHHTSKGNQGDKSVTDVGSGAGTMARRSDAHLVLRRHNDGESLILDAVTRTFPPQPPLGLYRADIIWQYKAKINVADIQGKGTLAEQAKLRRDKAGLEQLLNGLPQHGATVNQLKSLTGMGESRIKSLCVQGVEMGKLRQGTKTVNQRERTIYIPKEIARDRK